MPAQILLIDDDVDDQLIFREMIQEITTQIECIIAGNGLEGLGLLNKMQSPPAIIFLDLNMPLINGWEFLERIKTNDKINQIPIIILTTSDNKTDKKKALEQGARNLITKTADLGSLRKGIREILKAEQLLQ
jgi:CheY-like chemotaxis protein